jgi:transcriptional regulator GlxA family with amidase domain
MLLAHAGVLHHRPCTTHHTDRTALAEAGGQVIEARVVDDGDIVTAVGVTAGIDLSLWLLERWFGKETASAVTTGIEYSLNSAVHHTGRGMTVS